MRSLKEFEMVAAKSGINNAAKKLYKEFMQKNSLSKAEKDKRQNVVVNGETFGVSVETRNTPFIECRQFDVDYKGFITLDTTKGKVFLTTRSNVKSSGKSLVRPKSNKEALSVQATKFIELDFYSVF